MPSQESSTIRVVASASFWPNFWGSKDSIKYQLIEIYRHAAERLHREQQQRREAGCGACSESQPAEVVLESVPGKFLLDYEGEEACARRHEQTSQTPLQFPEQEFADIESVVTWYADFSRGYGEYGRLLYSQCEGECSPQYRLRLREEKGELLVRTEVVCGPARDREENSYTLSASIELNCAVSE